MSRALSVDLRIRVLAAVSAGATHREAAERLGVSAASVSRWRNLQIRRGDVRCCLVDLAGIAICARPKRTVTGSWHGWSSTGTAPCSNFATLSWPNASPSASRRYIASLSGTARR